MVMQMFLLGLFGFLVSISADGNKDHTKCKTVFHQYNPSPFEAKWTQNVESWQLDVCKHISNAEMNWWIGNVTTLMGDLEGSAVVSEDETPPKAEWSYIFPVFTYKKVCLHKSNGSSTTQYVHIPIEPTAAIARDPRKCWSPMTEKYTQSKEYLLPLSFQGATNSAIRSYNPSKTPAHQNITTFLFDAGATFPGKGHRVDNDWSGTDWIYTWYAKRGIVFDQVYGWEPRKGDLDKNDLDPAMAKALHFYNVGIDADLTSPNNPLHRIRTLCKPRDIVVFKLDIDNPMEMQVVKQLLGDPELLGLVDEFYYEHHVRNDLMRMHGLGGNDKSANLKTWYDMVLPARRKGLHMHFWP